MEFEELGGELLPALYVTYYHTREELQAALADEGIEIALVDSPAQTHWVEADDGRPAAIVLIEPERYDAATVGLIAHEAVHVVQTYLRWLGEVHPGDETQAYLVQAVMAYLIEAHTDIYLDANIIEA